MQLFGHLLLRKRKTQGEDAPINPAPIGPEVVLDEKFKRQARARSNTSQRTERRNLQERSALPALIKGKSTIWRKKGHARRNSVNIGLSLERVQRPQRRRGGDYRIAYADCAISRRRGDSPTQKKPCNRRRKGKKKQGALVTVFRVIPSRDRKTT